MKNETITFDELIDLFGRAYAVVMNERVMFLTLEETDEEDTYEIYLEDETISLLKEDNEEVQIQSDGLTFNINVRPDGSDDPEETEVRFLTLMKR
jgi:hypothetical protein